MHVIINITLLIKKRFFKFSLTTLKKSNNSNIWYNVYECNSSNTLENMTIKATHKNYHEKKLNKSNGITKISLIQREYYSKRILDL